MFFDNCKLFWSVIRFSILTKTGRRLLSNQPPSIQGDRLFDLRLIWSYDRPNDKSILLAPRNGSIGFVGQRDTHSEIAILGSVSPLSPLIFDNALNLGLLPQSSSVKNTSTQRDTLTYACAHDDSADEQNVFVLGEGHDQRAHGEDERSHHDDGTTTKPVVQKPAHQR